MRIFNNLLEFQQFFEIFVRNQTFNKYCLLFLSIFYFVLTRGEYELKPALLVITAIARSISLSEYGMPRIKRDETKM